MKLRLLAAFRFLLVPLVRILLRNGISFNEISEVLKGAYTRVATTDFAVPGRPMSYSRLSITTGIARRDFDRVLSEEDRLRRALESNASQSRMYFKGGTTIRSTWGLMDFRGLVFSVSQVGGCHSRT